LKKGSLFDAKSIHFKAYKTCQEIRKNLKKKNRAFMSVKNKRIYLSDLMGGIQSTNMLYKN